MLSVAIQASGDGGTFTTCAPAAAGTRPARMAPVEARVRRAVGVIGVLDAGRVWWVGGTRVGSNDEPARGKVSARPGGRAGTAPVLS